MRLQLLLAFSTIFNLSFGSAVIKLSSDDYYNEVFQQAVFIKFTKAGCSACKDSAPVWEELAETISDNKSIMIAEVECNDSNDDVCFDNEIESYPTYKYGDVELLLRTYKGATDLESLKQFSLENVRLQCSIHADQWCSVEDFKLIDSLREIPLEKLEANLEALSSAMASEFDAAQAKVEAAENNLDTAEMKLDVAKASGNSENIEFAKIDVKNAKTLVEEVESEFDTLLDKDEPVELLLMEELFEERDELDMLSES